MQTAPLTCPASVHKPTRWSYQRYGCRCPETVEVVRAIRRDREYLYRHRTPNLRARKRHSDFIDEIAVERACRGDVVELTAEERTEAVRRLVAKGLTAREVGERLGVTSRTVRRQLVRHRASTGRPQDVSRETSRETSDQGRTAA